MTSVRVLAAAMLAAILGLASAWHAARAHEAPSGFSYDPWCCNNGDCAELESARPTDDKETLIPTWVYRNKLGNEAPVEHGYTRFLPSPDNKTHACVWNESSPDAKPRYRLRCLYLGAGN